MLLDKWIELSDESGLVFEKELLPVGKYYKWSPDSKQTVSFNIDEAFLQHVLQETSRMNADGVPTKLYLNHNRTAEARRGDVESLTVKTNARGKTSLFGKIRFADDEAKKEGLRNDVSVGIPATVFSGEGKQYNRVLEHLAITSNPVVPGLEDYVAISASLDNVPETKMDKILKSLEIELSSDDQGKAEEAAVGAITSLRDDLTKASAKITELEKKLELSNEAPEATQYPEILLSEMTRSRMTRLEGLVKDGKLSPAQRDAIAKKHCTAEAINFDMNLSSSAQSVFDALLESHEANETFEFSGRSEATPIGHGQSDSQLVKAMERKAEEAKK